MDSIKVPLPVREGQIDFAYMESITQEIEKTRLNDLATYLKTTGLDNTKLTEKEQS